jgi:hypothetical protein
MGAWEELVAGQFFDSIMTPVTTLIGTEMFYAIIFGGIIIALMVRTKSLGLVMAMIAVTSAVFVPLIIPGVQKYLLILLLGGFVYYMFMVFKNRE